jgi:hypothetical protein
MLVSCPMNDLTPPLCCRTWLCTVLQGSPCGRRASGLRARDGRPGRLDQGRCSRGYLWDGALGWPGSMGKPDGMSLVSHGHLARTACLARRCSPLARTGATQ